VRYKSRCGLENIDQLDRIWSDEIGKGGEKVAKFGKQAIHDRVADKYLERHRNSIVYIRERLI